MVNVAASLGVGDGTHDLLSHSRTLCSLSHGHYKLRMSGDRIGEPSECIRVRVQAARDIQTKRFSGNGSSDIVCNADMRVWEIRHFCKLPEDAQSLMRPAMSQLNLSARAYHRGLKLACTIADLAGCEEIQSVHLAEALHAAQSSEVNDELKVVYQRE